jgi:hypothetical protein
MNESWSETPHAEPISPLSVNGNATGSTERSRRTIIIVAVAVLVTLCLCIGLCFAAGGWGIVSGMIKAIQEQDDVQAVIDEFMRAMVNQDSETAYALFSTRSQKNTALSDVEKLLQGNNFALFDGYQSLSVTNINIKAAFNTNPDMPQGTIAEVSGTITYNNNFIGKFTSVLEEENDEWKLFNINVTIPPDKLGSP